MSGWPVWLLGAETTPRFGTAPPIGVNCRVSIVAFSFSLKSFGPVPGGTEEKSGSEMRLKPVPTQVPARSAYGPRLEAVAAKRKARASVQSGRHELNLLLQKSLAWIISEVALL